MAGSFVVGIGNNDTVRSNGFRVDSTGKTYAKGAHSTTGADYAEYFEWSDGNPEARPQGPIRCAGRRQDQTLLTVSMTSFSALFPGRPAVVGNDYAEEWNGKFLTDIYGTPILSTYEVPTEYDEEGNLIRGSLHLQVVHYQSRL